MLRGTMQMRKEAVSINLIFSYFNAILKPLISRRSMSCLLRRVLRWVYRRTGKVLQ